MNTSLFIFVTSERPDPYLNSIGHNLLNEGVKEVVFVHIVGLEIPNQSRSDIEGRGVSAAVLRNVHLLLDGLAVRGEYRYFTNGHSDESVSLNTVYSVERVASIKAIYKQVSDKAVQWRHLDIRYPELRKELATLRKQPNSIFDVTAIKKLYLGDIIAVCIREGIHQLYTFDVKVSPNFEKPWTMLIHDLQGDGLEKRKYEYVNIVDTPVFKECANSILVRTPPLIISIVTAVAFLFITIAIYFQYGAGNWAINITSIVSAVGGLLSLYFNFFPPRR